MDERDEHGNEEADSIHNKQSHQHPSRSRGKKQHQQFKKKKMVKKLQAARAAAAKVRESSCHG